MFPSCFILFHQSHCLLVHPVGSPRARHNNNGWGARPRHWRARTGSPPPPRVNQLAPVSYRARHFLTNQLGPFSRWQWKRGEGPQTASVWLGFWLTVRRDCFFKVAPLRLAPPHGAPTPPRPTPNMTRLRTRERLFWRQLEGGLAIPAVFEEEQEDKKKEQTLKKLLKSNKKQINIKQHKLRRNNQYVILCYQL